MADFLTIQSELKLQMCSVWPAKVATACALAQRVCVVPVPTVDRGAGLTLTQILNVGKVSRIAIPSGVAECLKITPLQVKDLPCKSGRVVHEQPVR